MTMLIEENDEDDLIKKDGFLGVITRDVTITVSPKDPTKIKNRSEQESHRFTHRKSEGHQDGITDRAVLSSGGETNAFLKKLLDTPVDIETTRKKYERARAKKEASGRETNYFYNSDYPDRLTPFLDTN